MNDNTDEIAELRVEIDELKARISALEAERENSGDENKSGTEAGRWGDHRDHAVLDTLRPGQSYGSSDLERRYRRETDITSPGTLRGRVKSLTTSELFDQRGFGQWQFRGENDE